ncbi:DUF3147 family protein [Parasphingorhabdus halotolerans]|uniref:DUF3147 family protein n=1 Tax=Parasphingorhabdus halotolerans TaxID=2725558 RepID=A0A6H2DIW0_9SPHN|nr:DUF3147 family protein [Parasphingorhabdus halotolerans]QJB67923.1 DUF3147 family protein [Parasphingorhabdus halotolerans]
MTEFAVRAILSGIIIAVVAMIARRYPAMGALIASLPLISILAMIWLWRDTGDTNLIADHVQATFFYVIPSLPMFLLIPMMLRQGVNFWASLSAGILLTFVLYLVTIPIAARFGIKL